MKKLIIVLLLPVLFASCKKRQCWTCTVSITYSYGKGAGSLPIGRDTVTYCDLTKDQIKAIEVDGTKSTTYIEQGLEISTLTSTQCH